MSGRTTGRRMAVCVVAGVLMSVGAWGVDFIVKPISATASSELSVNYLISAAIDGSGLTSDLVTGAAVPDLYPAHTNGAWLTRYLANVPTNWMEFNLGGAFRISGFHLWNYNSSVGGEENRGLQSATVHVKISEQSYSTVTVSPLPYSKASGTTGYTGEDYTFATPVMASYIKFDAGTNYNADLVGISEIRFVASPPVTNLIIVKPTSATASSELSGNYKIDAAIDGSGLTSDLVTGAAVPDLYPAHTNGGWQTRYLANVSTNWMEFNLGRDFTISGFHVWNWNGDSEANRGLQSATVQVKVSGGAYTTVTVSPLPYGRAPGIANYMGEDYTFATPIVASHIKFDNGTNYGADYVGISEIRFLALPSATNGFIVKPINALASSESAYNNRYATNAIDGSGLSFDLVTGASVPLWYPSHTNTPDNMMWETDYYGAPDHIMTIATNTFDLGAVYLLTGFHMWNCNEIDRTGRSVSNGVLSVSLTGPIDGADSDYTVAPINASWFTQAPGLNSYLGEDYTFAQPVRARYVRLAALQNWGDPNLIGISEIRFIATIPRPCGTVMSFR